MADNDDDIPLLDDVLRPGDNGPGKGETHETTLSDAEIEAIAARVVERQTVNIEAAVARAITRALDLKARRRQSGSGKSRE